MTYTYPYPRPMVTTDLLLFHKSTNTAEVLLIERLNNPFKNHWALPGGFVDENESLLACAQRELFEETNIRNVPLTQFYTFGDPGRDPRGHTISTVYYAFVDKNTISLKAGDDAKNAAWFSINDLPDLAFDHNKIIKKALSELY